MQSLLIVKIGGNVIDQPAALDDFLQRFAALPAPKILVHGGGKLATELGQRLGIPSTMVDGRRITDPETLKIAAMVYAGLVNKTLVAKLQALGCDALGLSGADADVIRASKRPAGAVDFGLVGDVAPTGVRAGFLQGRLAEAQTPILAPITHDGNGQLLNTNADTIASSVAKALSGQYAVRLIYCFEKRGVLLDPKDDDSVLGQLQPEAFAQLRGSGQIAGGMIPKLENAFEALRAGVESVVIGHAAELAGLAATQAGTTIRL